MTLKSTSDGISDARMAQPCSVPLQLCLILVAILWPRATWAGGAEARFVATAINDGKLICLTDHGQICAWNIADSKIDEKLTTRLAHDSLKQIATDGEHLWSADAAALYCWSAKTASWEKSAEFDSHGEELSGLVIVNGLPLVVFPSKVIAPTIRRT